MYLELLAWNVLSAACGKSFWYVSVQYDTWLCFPPPSKIHLSEYSVRLILCSLTSQLGNTFPSYVEVNRFIARMVYTKYHFKF